MITKAPLYRRNILLYQTWDCLVVTGVNKSFIKVQEGDDNQGIIISANNFNYIKIE